KRDIKHETVKELVDGSNGLVEDKLLASNCCSFGQGCVHTAKTMVEYILATKLVFDPGGKWVCDLGGSRGRNVSGKHAIETNLVIEFVWKGDSWPMKSGVNCVIIVSVQGVSQLNHLDSCQSMVEEEEPEADIKVPEQVDTKVPGPVLEIVDNELVPEIVSKLIDIKADIEEKLRSQSHMTFFSDLGFNEETRESLRDTIALLIREELEKLRDEMRKCSRVTHVEFPLFGCDDVKGWLFKSEEFFKVNNIPDESKVGKRIVEDVVVETAKVDIEVGNEAVDDDKMGDDSEFLVMEVDRFVTDRNRSKLRPHKKMGVLFIG
nr:hypothetical protein [Tanacetum cinerariifolium]